MLPGLRRVLLQLLRRVLCRYHDPKQSCGLFVVCTYPRRHGFKNLRWWAGYLEDSLLHSAIAKRWMCVHQLHLLLGTSAKTDIISPHQRPSSTVALQVGRSSTALSSWANVHVSCAVFRGSLCPRVLATNLTARLQTTRLRPGAAVCCLSYGRTDRLFKY